MYLVWPRFCAACANLFNKAELPWWFSVYLRKSAIPPLSPPSTSYEGASSTMFSGGGVEVKKIQISLTILPVGENHSGLSETLLPMIPSVHLAQFNFLLLLKMMEWLQASKHLL
jgi:hypothetical protein